MLPLLAIGGLYVISNKDEPTTKKENYTNLNNPKQLVSNLQNNFPVSNTIDDSPNQYPSLKTEVDKYFNANQFAKMAQVGDGQRSFYSLTGEKIDEASLTHNNMIPFNSARNYGHTTDTFNARSYSTLDHDQFYRKKEEQAPLFKPMDTAQNPFGMTGIAEYEQQRQSMLFSNKMDGVRPFEPMRENAGTNSLMNREQVRTVDELRTATNPKLTHNTYGMEGPANSLIKNRGQEGIMQKNHPDMYWETQPAMWGVGTSINKEKTARPIIENDKDDSYAEYVGVWGNTYRGIYAPENFENPKKKEPQLNNIVGVSSAIGRGNIEMQNNGRQTSEQVMQTKNNRNSYENTNHIGSGIRSALSSVVSPIMDIMRPTKRQELISNTKVHANRNLTPQSGSAIYITSNQQLKPTMKETALHQPRSYVNNQERTFNYLSNEKAPDINDRYLMSVNGYSGHASSVSGGAMRINDGDRNYTPNDLKSSMINNRANGGNMSLFAGDLGYGTIGKSDSLSYSYYGGACNTLGTEIQSSQFYGEQREPAQEYTYQNRNTSDLLTSLRGNPYVKSFTNI